MGGAKATQCQFGRGLRWMTYDTIICVDTDDPDTMTPKTGLHRHPVDLVFGGEFDLSRCVLPRVTLRVLPNFLESRNGTV